MFHPVHRNPHEIQTMRKIKLFSKYSFSLHCALKYTDFTLIESFEKLKTLPMVVLSTMFSISKDYGVF